MDIKTKAALLTVVGLLSACNEVDRCSDSPSSRGSLYATAKEHVSAQLRSPSTASFQPLGGRNGAIIMNTGECKFVMRFYVDAQNAFGAMVRTEFRYTVTYNTKTNQYFFVRS